MFTRVVVLLALAACCAAASLPETKDVALGFHEGDQLVREQRAVQGFLQTLGPSPAALKGGKDQSFNYGGLYQYDRQLHSTTVYQSGTLWTVHKKVVSFSSTYTIHCIQIVDLQKNGKNAEVTLQSGGPGQRQANLRFKSQRGGNINYLVILWGQ